MLSSAASLFLFRACRLVRPLSRALGVLALLLLSQQAQAHPAPFSYLDLNLQEERIDGRLTVHIIDLAHELDMDDPETLLDQDVLQQQYGTMLEILEQRFRIGSDMPDPQWQAITLAPGDDAVRFDFTIPAAPPGALDVQAHMFPYDPVHQTFVNVYEDADLRQQWILSEGDETRTHYAGTTAGVMAVMATFIPSGIHHILIGPDHILFLVALLLLGGSLKRLAIIVTSFTIGHSVTLSLAALGMVMIPAAIVEPLIALSIVFVAADNLLRAEGRDLRAGIAFVFGLVHGFGFAYVLREFGLPDAALVWSLFSFNLGVEIGQLAIVVVVAGLLHLLRRHSEKAARQVATIGSLAVMAAGVYWFVDRVFFSGAG